MTEVTDKAVETVQLRNNFYRDSYRKILIALLLCVAVILIQVAALIYVISNPPAPKYFATTTEGRIMPLVPLGEPNLSTAALLQWANTAAVAAYTYDFVNYRQALQSAKQYFTEDGFDNFMTALKSSNILDAVIAKKLIVTAVATGAPVVVQQGLVLGSTHGKCKYPCWLPIKVLANSYSNLLL